MDNAVAEEPQRIVKYVLSSFVYKGVRKPRIKKVYNKYEKCGHPCTGNWAPSPDQIELIRGLRNAGIKYHDLAAQSGLKAYQVQRIVVILKNE